MTIAVGALATDGVVLAADTQLTIQNYWKGESGKIMAVARRRHAAINGACAVTGATDRFNYLHALGDELCNDFLNNIDGTEKAAAFVRFSNIVHGFQLRNVAPYQDLPDIGVLVAYERDGKAALWQSDRATFFEQPDHGAVGIGASAAQSWLMRVWKPGLNVPQIVMATIFATAVAKQRVDGCGQFTNVLVVQCDGWYRVPQKLVNESTKCSGSTRRRQSLRSSLRRLVTSLLASLN